MQRVVIVTGGCGFIGTWVLRTLLDQGDEPIVIDTMPNPARWQRVLGARAEKVRRADVSLLERDALAALIETTGATHIVHLAALLTPACQQDPSLGCRVNVLGSTTLFDAARLTSRIHAIAYASSYAVYGPEELDVNGQAQDSQTFYGAFKQAFDIVAQQFWRHFGIASVAFRPHVVYGPERDVGLTAGPSLAAKAAALGESYTIGYTGSAGYDYVEDVAAALLRGAFECPPGANVVDLPGEQACCHDVIRAIEKAVPEAAGRIRAEGPPLPNNVSPRIHPMTQLFSDWKPIPLLEGMRKTVAFYQSKGVHS